MQIDYFKNICEKQCGLRYDQTVLVAFSGGADSLSLLYLLREASFPVTAAHFNHHLRPASDLDELTAGGFTRELDIPFISGGVDVFEFSRAHKLSVEEAARQCRYNWLFDQARHLKAQAIAVGHTADDQVETVLMHLLRGAGLDGMRGMLFRQILPVWEKEIPLVRPLLNTWRSETEKICSDAGFTPVHDESNQSIEYFRNRIRLDLVPYLQEFNPQVKPHILQTTKILAEEENMLERIKIDAWSNCFDRRSDQWVSFHQPELKMLPEGLRRAVLRKAMCELDPERRDIDFEATLALSDFVLSPSRSGMMRLPGSIWAQIANNRLILWIGEPGLIEFLPQIDVDKEYRLAIKEPVNFAGWQIEIREDDLSSAISAIQNGGCEDSVWLDADKLIFPLTIRCSQPGERLLPFGMDGRSQKISDYWVNRKVPRQARKNWPVVVSGQSIVWIPGHTLSELAAITSQTRRVMRISLQLLDHQPDDPV